MSPLKKINLPLRLFISALLALAIAFAFDFLFLKLTERPITDQIFLMVFSTVPLGYLIFSLWGTIIESGGLRITAPKIQFNSAAISSFLREHAPGIVLALLFFATYMFFALQINFANSDTTDNFF